MSNLTIDHAPALEGCINFLNAIGIKTVVGQINTQTFLPGILIQKGGIIIDPDALEYPGDILHEAGHIAVVPENERKTLDGASIENRENRDAEEMMAIAWSYAACIHLSLDPSFVFHEGGYNGGGGNIADNFHQKQYFGLPMLQWIGLTADEKNAKELNVAHYPTMIKWLRD